MTQAQKLMKRQQIESELRELQLKLNRIFLLLNNYTLEYGKTPNSERRSEIISVKNMLLKEVHKFVHRQDKLFHSLPL